MSVKFTPLGPSTNSQEERTIKKRGRKRNVVSLMTGESSIQEELDLQPLQESHSEESRKKTSSADEVYAIALIEEISSTVECLMERLARLEEKVESLDSKTQTTEKETDNV